MDEYFRQYGVIAIFASLAVAIPVGMFLISWLLSLVKVRPNNPSEVKSSIYECGFETIDTRWNTFNFRYYSIALLFVIFDVEAVFIFPWAINLEKLGYFGLIEMFVFIFILLIGLIYAIRKDVLKWES